MPPITANVPGNYDLYTGSVRLEGEITRGTTNPSRLRRVDRWITQAERSVLISQEGPLVVDLGFGASPVTTLELYRRVREVAPSAEVTGLEIDPERVAAARRRLAGLRASGVELPGLGFALGGAQRGQQRLRDPAVRPPQPARVRRPPGDLPLRAHGATLSRDGRVRGCDAV